MGKKDRGWDYLNSSGDEFDYDKENDGSWGYENDDGSGSFYGADGSWGYKNSDGSASYYGADGSWGYKNADGSSSYYGNDGSWGYKNSDGSGSYYGSDNESEYFDSDNDDDSDYSSGDGDVGGGAAVVGALLGLGLAAFAAGKSKRNQSDYDYDSDDDDEYYDEEFEILGARKGLDDNGMADRNLVKLKPGDQLTTLLYVSTISGDEEFELYEVDEFEVTEDTSFAEEDLGDGTFAMMFQLTDCRGNDIWSDVAIFTVEDGCIYAES